MASSAKTGPQDMPPPGGYDPIQTARVKLKTIFTARRCIAAFAASQVYGYFKLTAHFRNMRKEDIEMRSARFAIKPFLDAEHDREYLKQLRRNRDAERELMKNYPDWEVGTFFGEPIYETIDTEETWMNPKFAEYIIHAPEDTFGKKAYVRHWT